ncbi:MAG: 5'-nucleotidase C-terminal domain-containing protein [Firmicutes bacterium]|nr:5'-nucleotidase C-terminal domain-containing protein [Bacillota bacterium]
MKLRGKVLSLALAIVMMLAMVPATAFAAEGEKTITIIATSDLHGNIWGYSYEDNAETTNNGMARVYNYVQQVRAENPNTILIDGGDTIQGTIMTDDLYTPNPELEHPVIAVMNYMDYDAMTLGNHEFNWGIPTMNAILAQADFPMLSANVKKADGTPVTGLGYTIIERAGVKVAVIGVTTPNVPIWDGGKAGIDELTYGAADKAVKEAIAEIGDKADIIMVDAHMGMFAEFDEEGGADSGNKIIETNPEIDALYVGHMHITVNEKVGNTIVGGCRNAGREIGRYDFVVDKDNNVVSSTVELVDMANYEPSAEIRDLAIVKEAQEKTIAFVTGAGGEDGEEGGSSLGTTTAKFQPVDEIATLPEGKLQDTAVMDLINKIQLEASGADVSAAALFKDTSDLPEGGINYGNIFDIYKFDNTLYRVTVTGAELKAYMEWAANCYNQWEEGDINISFDPEYPGYLYDMFAGVDYEIDLSQPKGQRIVNVMFKGAPLKDDQTLTLAVNNYRYSSGLKAQKLVSGTREWESAEAIRTMIVKYFEENSPVAPEVDNNWRITGVDLNEDDPRRAELIALINAGKLPAPYAESYNLADYDELIELAGGPLEKYAPLVKVYQLF